MLDLNVVYTKFLAYLRDTNPDQNPIMAFFGETVERAKTMHQQLPSEMADQLRGCERMKFMHLGKQHINARGLRGNTFMFAVIDSAAVEYFRQDPREHYGSLEKSLTTTAFATGVDSEQLVMVMRPVWWPEPFQWPRIA